MSEIETYIAVEQFFGGGGLFRMAPGLGDKTWGFSLSPALAIFDLQKVVERAHVFW
jgi:hypothetical protein